MAKKSYVEQDLQLAISDVHNGLSMRKAAKLHGVPTSTIAHRLSGTQNRQTSHQHLQKLSPAQEKSLCSWVVIQDSIGCPPTHAQIKEFAGHIAKQNGYKNHIGTHWMAAFLRRNPDVKNLKGRNLETSRYNGATAESIKHFFTTKIEDPAIKAVKPENRYNMDEIGIVEGLGSNCLVVGSSNKKITIPKNSSSRSWMTILECISATGRPLSPLATFEGKTVQQQRFPVDIDFLDTWYLTASEKGWTNDNFVLVWLKNIFIPQTKPAKEEEKRILIVDGHKCHQTTEFMFECYSNNIHIIFLIPNSSHVLQPLDLAFFGRVKNAYRKELNKLTVIDDSTQFSKALLIECYYKARKASLASKNIIAGWKASGLWPVSMAKPLKNTMKSKLEQLQVTPPEAMATMSEATQSPIQTLESPPHLMPVLKSHSSSIKTSRNFQLSATKTGSPLDKQPMAIAGLDGGNSNFGCENEDLQPRKKRKVSFEPTETAIMCPEITKARREMFKKLDPPGTSARVKNTKFKDMCINWQLNIPEMPDLIFK